MKATAAVLSIFVAALLTGPPQTQSQVAHHGSAAMSIKSDTSAVRGMMPGSMMSGGMMSGGKMGGQMMHCQGCRQMMGGRMMGQMMGGQGMMTHHGRLAKFKDLIQRLPNLTQQLSLTDGQVQNLKKIRTEFLKRRADWQAAIEKKQIDLSELLDSSAPTSQIRAALGSISDTKLETSVATYDTYQKMLSVLNAEQRSKLKTLSSHRCGGSEMMKKGMQRSGEIR